MMNIKNLLSTASICATVMLPLVACGDKTAEVQATHKAEKTAKSAPSSENSPKSKSTLPADAPTFVMAVEKSYPPFVEQDKHGLPSGFDIDLINAIAEESKFHINIKIIKWDSAFAGLKQGKYDILGSGVSITEKRKEFASFSTPYFESYMAFATINDDINSVKDMTDKKIGLQSSTTYYQTMQDMFGKTNTIKDYKTVFLSCQAMLAKQEDVCIGDVAYLQYFKASLKDDANIPKIKIFEVSGTDKDQLAFAVQKDNEKLLTLVNAGLEQVKGDGTYDKIKAKWFGE